MRPASRRLGDGDGDPARTVRVEVCAYTFPFGEYQEGGGVLTVPGLEAVSSIDYLP